MKRAMVLFLILSLASVPMFAMTEQTKYRCVSLEHQRGGWTMTIECTPHGTGTISRADDGTYSGSAMFAKWSQQELGSTYQSLIPSDETRVDFLQLG